MRPATVTDVGPRDNNEDAAFASPRLLAVADGVGGAVAGELASRLVVDKMRHLSEVRLEHGLVDELVAAVADANDVIEFAAVYDPDVAGLATTLTAVALSNDGEYLIANVGDSRTYLYRDGRLERLTRDQSLVQELIDRGAVTEIEARHHPQRSIVLEALDGVRRPLPPVSRAGARAGDRLLLCSDGVTDYLGDEQIAESMALADAGAVAGDLVRRALAEGGRDNATAVVADVVARNDPEDGWLDYLPFVRSAA